MYASINGLWVASAASLRPFAAARASSPQPAIIAGFALSPLTSTALPEFKTAGAHLREVLGEATYESLARTGEVMTTAPMVTYAYDQIDQARAALANVSE